MNVSIDALTYLPDDVLGIIYDYANCKSDIQLLSPDVNNVVDKVEDETFHLKQSIIHLSNEPSLYYLDEIIQTCGLLSNNVDTINRLQWNQTPRLENEPFAIDIASKDIFSLYSLYVREIFISNHDLLKQKIALFSTKTKEELDDFIECCVNHKEEGMKRIQELELDNSAYSILTRYEFAEQTSCIRGLYRSRPIWNFFNEHVEVMEKEIIPLTAPLILKLRILCKLALEEIEDISETEMETCPSPFESISRDNMRKASLANALRLFIKYIRQYHDSHRKVMSEQTIRFLRNIKSKRPSLLTNLTECFGEYKTLFWKKLKITDHQLNIPTARFMYIKPSLYLNQRHRFKSMDKTKDLLHRMYAKGKVFVQSLSKKDASSHAKVAITKLRSRTSIPCHVMPIYKSLTEYSKDATYFDVLLNHTIVWWRHSVSNMCDISYRIIITLLLEWYYGHKTFPNTFDVHPIIMESLQYQVGVSQPRFYIQTLQTYMYCFSTNSLVVQFCIEQAYKSSLLNDYKDCFYYKDQSEVTHKHDPVMIAILKCLFIPRATFNINQQSRDMLISMSNKLHSETDKLLLFMWLDLANCE